MRRWMENSKVADHVLTALEVAASFLKLYYHTRHSKPGARRACVPPAQPELLRREPPSPLPAGNHEGLFAEQPARVSTHRAVEGVGGHRYHAQGAAGRGAAAALPSPAKSIE